MRSRFSTIGISAAIGVLLGGGAVFSFMQPPPPSASSPESEGGGKLFNQREGISESTDESTLHYTHPQYGFSLDFPKELEISRYDEGGNSETIVFQKPNEQVGFQIFVTPYFEAEITTERLQKDVRSGAIEEPTEVIIGGGQRALVFWGNDPIVGRLREVWFIHDKYLYEVTAYAELDSWLAEILETWKFE